MTTTSIRAARPELAEGLAFARFLDTAAEGLFRLMLGAKAPEILSRAFTAPDHDLSFRNVLFAERDGDVLGMAASYSARQHRSSSDRPLREAAGPRAIRMAVVALAMWPMLRVIDRLDEGEFYLMAIAVAPEARGAGAGTALLDAVERRAAEAGAVRLVLDVSGDNEGARRLYERRGFTVQSRWPRRLRLPGLRLLRMAKPLEPPPSPPSEAE